MELHLSLNCCIALTERGEFLSVRSIERLVNSVKNSVATRSSIGRELNRTIKLIHGNRLVPNRSAAAESARDTHRVRSTAEVDSEDIRLMKTVGKFTRACCQEKVGVDRKQPSTDRFDDVIEFALRCLGTDFAPTVSCKELHESGKLSRKVFVRGPIITRQIGF